MRQARTIICRRARAMVLSVVKSSHSRGHTRWPQIEAGDRWLEWIDFSRPCRHQRLCNFSCSETLNRD